MPLRLPPPRARPIPTTITTARTEPPTGGFFFALEAPMTTSDTLDASEDYRIPIQISGMPSESYHKHPGLGSTSIKTLAMRTPAHWRYEQDHPVHKDAYDAGTLAHSLILEDRCDAKVIDVEDKRGKKWSEPAVEARAEGLIPVTAAEWADVVAMRDSVMSNAMAKRAFTDHVAEESMFFAHETGTPLKIRPDAMHEGGELGPMVADLKTVQSASGAEFARTAARFGYHIQQAHYQNGLRAVMEEDFAFVFVLVERTPPFLTNVVELDPEDVERGARLAEHGIRIYNQCVQSGEWPGYGDTGLIELPRWARITEEAIVDV